MYMEVMSGKMQMLFAKKCLFLKLWAITSQIVKMSGTFGHFQTFSTGFDKVFKISKKQSTFSQTFPSYTCVPNFTSLRYVVFPENHPKNSNQAKNAFPRNTAAKIWNIFINKIKRYVSDIKFQKQAKTVFYVFLVYLNLLM